MNTASWVTAAASRISRDKRGAAGETPLEIFSKSGSEPTAWDWARILQTVCAVCLSLLPDFGIVLEPLSAKFPGLALQRAQEISLFQSEDAPDSYFR
jgi:hypothetical protein